MITTLVGITALYTALNMLLVLAVAVLPEHNQEAN